VESVINWLLDFLITLPVILLSLSVHEFMHGFAAYRLGDSTAKYMGRLSLNPLRHIDPLGFVALIFFHVGWAKPVSVNARAFKNPKRDMAITALAGPVSNFVLAFLFSFVSVFLYRLGLTLGWFAGNEISPFYVLWLMTRYMVIINLGLGIFNLIPIPPLDGSKILYAFLPYRVIVKIVPYEKYLQFAMLLLLWIGALSVPIQRGVTFFLNLFTDLAMGVFF